MEKTDIQPISIYVISAVALLINIFFIILYFLCPLRNINSYKYFFLITALQNIIYTATFVLVIPRIISQDYSLIFIATGTVKYSLLAFNVLILFVTVFICSIVSVTNSFVYRYLQLCRARLLQKYPSKVYVLVGSLVNFFVILDFIIVIYFAFWPNEDFEQLIWHSVEIPGINLKGVAFLGMSLKYNMSGFHLALVINIALVLAFMVSINLFCSLKIHGSLRNTLRSNQSILLQRRMFVLLQLQACSPFVFLHIPCFFAFFLLFAEISSTPLITDIICTLMTLYPMSNPIIIVVFIKDYRDFLLYKLHLRQSSERTVSSQIRSATTKSTRAPLPPIVT
ncbi:hypothetical protein V3C99_009955 [Haemonchus contortus]